MDVELKVTAKGQVTLKKALLQHLGVKPGDRLSVSMRQDGRVELGPVRKKRSIDDLSGLLSRPGQKALTIDEIQEGIIAGALAEFERSR